MRALDVLDREVAGHLVTGTELAQHRLLDLALLLGLPAAGVEHAAGGRVDRAGQVALQQDALALAGRVGVGHRHGGQQRVGVGVQRLLVEAVAVGQLHDVTEVHHRDAVGDVPDDRQVVRDEDVGDAELVLDVLEQVDDLRLDRHVERGDRLVADDELGPQRDGAGDADALALAAGELVRVAVVVLGVEPDALHEVLDLGLDAAGRLDALHLERRGDDRADGVPRVQRVVRVLEDHLRLAAERHASPCG